MVEIRYGEQYKAADLAGLTVSEAREQFKTEFGIPDKATARLNGSKVRENVELDTVLNDDDKLSFAVARSRGAYLVGALLLVLAVTGGVFAAGFINATATLNGSVKSSNFADVSLNTAGISDLSWTAYGSFKGAIVSSTTNGTPIFNIDTATSGYTGDLVVTITLGNTDQLAKVYRLLALKLGMNAPDGSPIDINESGAADSNDWVMLTLENGSVSMFPKAAASNNVCTVRVLSGFYLTHVCPGMGWSGSASPDLFCEVAQR
jgi:molybdopterin converting factor small subunit